MKQKPKILDHIALGIVLAAIAVSVGSFVGIIFMLLRGLI